MYNLRLVFSAVNHQNPRHTNFGDGVELHCSQAFHVGTQVGFSS